MVKLGKLPDTAIHVFSNLWLDERVPNRVDIIASRLMEAGARLMEWRCCTAHAGVDMALKFVFSWYEGVDLDALATLRLNAPTMTNLDLNEQCQQRAYQIARYASVITFIPAPPDAEDEESDDEESEEGADDEVAVEDASSAPVDPTAQDPASSTRATGNAPPKAPEAHEAGAALIPLIICLSQTAKPLNPQNVGW
jgi:hypothetical protein